MAKTSYAGEADDAGGRRRPGLGWTTLRRVAEAGMDPLGVVVGHVVSEQALEMTFAEDDHVIEKLAPAGAYPPLGDGVLPGAAVRRAHGLKARMLSDRDLAVTDAFGLRNQGIHSGPPFGAEALPVPTSRC